MQLSGCLVVCDSHKACQASQARCPSSPPYKRFLPRYLIRHFIDSGPSCSACSAYERSCKCSLSLGYCGVPKNRACDAKAKKVSELTQLTDTCVTGMVALAESIIRARQHKPEARRTAVTGGWGPTCTDSTLTRGEEAALARLRTGVSQKYLWQPRPLQPAIPRTCHCRGPYFPQQTRNELCTETPPPPAGPHHAAIQRLADCPVCGKHCSCRTSFVTHMVNARGITRSPRRCGNSTFPVSRNRQKPHRNHRPALWCGREREAAHRLHLRHRMHSPGRSHSLQSLLGVVQPTSRTRFYLWHFHKQEFPRQLGGVARNTTVWLRPPRSNAFPVDSRTKQKRDQYLTCDQTKVPKRSCSRHQMSRHFFSALAATNRREIPGYWPHKSGTSIPTAMRKRDQKWR
ncbi:hypothetical protein C3747_2g69 [Trypanosoma cruzi]|uniref:Uncharacterized protein n=1 Tax=Trypanosoma cruzi TaxID=5693 RepID=A0A2V2XKR4_TRYCR|nr:hypothetical protein C3747_2g69 [Trypanosoma cruzi]